MDTTLVCIDVYTVKEEDTLYSIGEKYDVPVSLLMKINCIRDPYNLQVGYKICIPGTPEQLPPVCSPQAPPPPKPVKPALKKHTVVAGDTLYLIAKKYSVKLSALINANPNLDPYNLTIGTQLIIPY